MIKLIRNEFYKLLRPRNILPFLLCILAVFGFFFRFYRTNLPDPVHMQSEAEIREILASLTENHEPDLQIEKYRFLLDHHLQLAKTSWQMDALDLAFFTYKAQTEESKLSPRRLASCYRYQKLFCDVVLSGNHQAYLQLLAEQMQNDSRLSSADKYSYSLYYSYLISQNVIPASGDWRETAALNLLNSRLMLSSLETISEKEVPNYDRLWKDAYHRQLIAEYRISHNVDLFVTQRTSESSLLWKSLFGSSRMYVLLYLPLILMFSGSIASESQNHRLALQLTAPVGRRSFWCAKTLCIFITCLVSCIVLFSLRILAACICFGFEDFPAVSLFVRDGQVSSYPTVLLLLRSDLIACVPLYVMGAFILLCSTLLPDSRLTALVCFFALLLTCISYVSPEIAMQSSLKYTIFGTANLLYVFEHSSIWYFLRSLAIQLVHLIAFLAVGIWIFEKKTY